MPTINLKICIAERDVRFSRGAILPFEYFSISGYIRRRSNDLNKTTCSTTRRQTGNWDRCRRIPEFGNFVARFVIVRLEIPAR